MRSRTRTLSILTLAVASLTSSSEAASRRAPQVAISSGPARSAAVGVEVFAARDQATKMALVAGALEWTSTDILGGLLRFDDRHVGTGNGFLLGGGVALGRSTSLRVLGSRFFAEDDFQAWRIRFGPQWILPGGPRMGLFYAREGNNAGGSLAGVTSELLVPLSSRLDASLSATFARSEPRDGGTAAAGLGWRPISHLELSGEIGLTSFANSTLAVGALGSELDDPSAPPSTLSGTISLGARVIVP